MKCDLSFIQNHIGECRKVSHLYSNRIHTTVKYRKGKWQSQKIKSRGSHLKISNGRGGAKLHNF